MKVTTTGWVNALYSFAILSLRFFLHSAPDGRSVVEITGLTRVGETVIVLRRLGLFEVVGHLVVGSGLELGACHTVQDTSPVQVP